MPPAWRSRTMIVRTDAVVLRSFDYGETSQIVTLLTRQNGVIGVMAKGARRPSSRFGSTLQPTSYIQAVYYYRAGRGLQTLTETTHLARFSRLRSDLERITLGLRAIEVARLALDEGEAHPLALEALARTLTFLDASNDNAGNALLWFQLRMAGLLGFSPRHPARRCPRPRGRWTSGTGLRRHPDNRATAGCAPRPEPPSQPGRAPGLRHPCPYRPRDCGAHEARTRGPVRCPRPGRCLPPCTCGVGFPGTGPDCQRPSGCRAGGST